MRNKIHAAYTALRDKTTMMVWSNKLSGINLSVHVGETRQAREPHRFRRLLVGNTKRGDTILEAGRALDQGD